MKKFITLIFFASVLFLLCYPSALYLLCIHYGPKKLKIWAIENTQDSRLLLEIFLSQKDRDIKITTIGSLISRDSNNKLLKPLHPKVYKDLIVYTANNELSRMNQFYISELLKVNFNDNSFAPISTILLYEDKISRRHASCFLISIFYELKEGIAPASIDLLSRKRFQIFIEKRIPNEDDEITKMNLKRALKFL